MVIDAVIIDDERNVRNILKQTLSEFFAESIAVVGEADGVASGKALIEAEKPDLVFLDIKMKGGTGFDLLQQLDAIDFEVIFVTAYDEYAMDAFDCSAFGYLLKPIQVSKLTPLLDKLTNNLNDSLASAEKRLKVLVENYGNEQVSKLVINNRQGFEVIDLRQIIRLEASGNYTEFYMRDGKQFTSSRTLKKYEDLLHQHGFSRVHQQHIINLSCVIRYEAGIGGTVILSDGSPIPISRKRKPSFLKRFL